MALIVVLADRTTGTAPLATPPIIDDVMTTSISIGIAILILNIEVRNKPLEIFLEYR